LPSAITDWDGVSDTYIQKDSITDDLGVFNTPDEFCDKYGTNLKGFKKWLYENWIRFKMNENVEQIRKEFSKV
jgi:hypothetical protein